MEVYLSEKDEIIPKQKRESLEKDSLVLGGISQMIKTGKSAEDIKKYLLSMGYKL